MPVSGLWLGNPESCAFIPFTQWSPSFKPCAWLPFYLILWSLCKANEPPGDHQEFTVLFLKCLRQLLGDRRDIVFLVCDFMYLYSLEREQISNCNHMRLTYFVVSVAQINSSKSRGSGGKPGSYSSASQQQPSPSQNHKFTSYQQNVSPTTQLVSLAFYINMRKQINLCLK